MCHHEMNEELKEFHLERIELDIRGLELEHTIVMSDRKAERAMIIGDTEAYRAAMSARTEAVIQLISLNEDIDKYNEKLAERFGQPFQAPVVIDLASMFSGGPDSMRRTTFEGFFADSAAVDPTDFVDAPAAGN